MVMIKSLYECPRCSEAIVASGSETSCPSCGLVLGHKPGSIPYDPPLTLNEQELKHANKSKHVQALLNLREEKAISMMQDALNIIELLPGQKWSLAGIRTVNELAVRAGNIAKAYDEFLQARGVHVPHLLRQLDDEKKQETSEPKILPSPVPLFQENPNEQSTYPEGRTPG